ADCRGVREWCRRRQGRRRRRTRRRGGRASRAGRRRGGSAAGTAGDEGRGQGGHGEGSEDLHADSIPASSQKRGTPSGESGRRLVGGPASFAGTNQIRFRGSVV